LLLKVFGQQSFLNPSINIRFASPETVRQYHQSTLTHIFIRQSAMADMPIIAKASTFFLAAFFLFCLQGHLTPAITPSFHHLIHESADKQVRAFWIGTIFQPSGDAFLVACELINAGLAASIIYRPTQQAGLLSALGFLLCGLYGDVYIGDSILPHVVLLAICGIAILGRMK
jgi:hypothetical protein